MIGRRSIATRVLGQLSMRGRLKPRAGGSDDRVLPDLSSVSREVVAATRKYHARCAKSREPCHGQGDLRVDHELVCEVDPEGSKGRDEVRVNRLGDQNAVGRENAPGRLKETQEVVV